MKRLIFIFISIYFSVSLIGQQTLDVFTVSSHYSFPQSYDSIYNSKAKESGFMANLVTPIKISEKSIWYNSLNYFYWHVSNEEELPPEIANPISVHGIILRTGLYQKFSKDRGIQIFFMPRLMSDFNNINGNHFQIGGMALFEKKFHDKLTMGFGAMFNQELYGPYLIPLINLNWQLSDRWSIIGLLPIYAKIKYKVNDKFTTGISHFGLGTSYSLGNPNYKGDYIERKSINLGLFGRHQISRNIYLEGRIGYSLDRSYAQYQADQKVDFSIPLITFGDNRIQKNISFHDGLFINLRFVYNVPITVQDK